MAADGNGQAVHTQPNDRQWERVGDQTHRMRVDGGWLYKVESYNGQISLQFVAAVEVQGDYQTRTGRSFMTG